MMSFMQKRSNKYRGLFLLEHTKEEGKVQRGGKGLTGTGGQGRREVGEIERRRREVKNEVKALYR